MKTIIETPGEPYMIEDRTTPVFETRKHKSRLWLSLHEAASVTGETISDIVRSADTQTPTARKNQFGYPTRAVLRTYLPDYKFVRNQPHPPVPVVAIFRLKGSRKSEQVAYRTLTAFRQCNMLTVPAAEAIFSQHSGWTNKLPPLMTTATPQQPGWVPTGGWPTTPGARTSTIIFELTPVKGRVAIKYIGPPSTGTIREVPAVILAHAK